METFGKKTRYFFVRNSKYNPFISIKKPLKIHQKVADEDEHIESCLDLIIIFVPVTELELVLADPVFSGEQCSTCTHAKTLFVNRVEVIV